MERKLNRIFWCGYIFFCVWTVFLLEFFDLIDLSTMGLGEDIIFTAFLLICGLVIRYWFKSNPEEVKRRFKL